jgi:hypothetical protein
MGEFNVESLRFVFPRALVYRKLNGDGFSISLVP